MFVTGGSGGGVLTAWIVGQTPRFRAAAAQKPVINWASFSLTTDMATYVPKYWFGKQPWEDPQGYWKHSPLSLVGNVTTPTLVVVGDAGFPHSGERFRAVLRGSEVARHSDGAGESAGRLARRARGAAVAIGRQGERYTRVVPTLSRRQLTNTSTHALPYEG